MYAWNARHVETLKVNFDIDANNFSCPLNFNANLIQALFEIFTYIVRCTWKSQSYDADKMD